MIEAAIETPIYDLTVFKLHFGRLTGKAYTKGERVLRFEAIAHNTAELRCGRMIEMFSRDRHPARLRRRTVRHRPGLRGLAPLLVPRPYATGEHCGAHR